MDPGAVLGVIPARYGASRFPGKPLAPLWGKPLVQNAWEAARRIQDLNLIVATDDERIARAARGFGARIEMTSAACASGTDRVAEVARRHPEARIVVNLQGDEPELDVTAVSTLISGMISDPLIQMATLAHPEHDPEVLASRAVVKVGVDEEGWALYFTREDPAVLGTVSLPLRHIGVYGFQRQFLFEFASWPPGDRERAEQLEQLRAFDRGVRIRVFRSEVVSRGVDTPEQLAELERRGPRAAR